MLGRTFLVLSLCLITLVPARILAHEEDEDSIPQKDSAAGLPKPYATTHLIAADTISPDKKMAVIYPNNADDENAKDFLVLLKPFKILTALETKWPYFANESHEALRAQWAPDNSVALVTLDRKWGPGDVFLYELRDGNVTRATNLSARVHDLLKPDYDQVQPEPYNDETDFIFDDDMVGDVKNASNEPAQQFKLSSPMAVEIDAGATTDPKHIGGIKAWDAKFKGTWDVPQAKFTDQKVTRVFAGKRKDD